MATFTKHINEVLKKEGGYANHKQDKGGETYRGIARNFWGTWSGWKAIDLKKKSIEIKTNQIFIELENQVRHFYKINFWDRLKLSEVENEDVAYMLFDTSVLHGTRTAAKWVQEVVKVKQDGAIGPISLKAINTASIYDIIDFLKDKRTEHYNNSNQDVFKQGWLRRLDQVMNYMPARITANPKPQEEQPS